MIYERSITNLIMSYNHIDIIYILYHILYHISYHIISQNISYHITLNDKKCEAIIKERSIMNLIISYNHVDIIYILYHIIS